MKQIVETNRLNIRELRYSDATFIVKLFNNNSYIKYNGNNDVISILDGENYLFNGPIKSYNENNYGIWLVELKNNKTPIGICGFEMSNKTKNLQMKCAYLPQFCKNGFAFEAGSEVLIYAKEKLNIKSVFANTVAGNIPAIKLLEKLGFEHKKNIMMPFGQEDYLQFIK